MHEKHLMLILLLHLLHLHRLGRLAKSQTNNRNHALMQSNRLHRIHLLPLFQLAHFQLVMIPHSEILGSLTQDRISIYATIQIASITNAPHYQTTTSPQAKRLIRYKLMGPSIFILLYQTGYRKSTSSKI